jgi:hypothetical protein
VQDFTYGGVIEVTGSHEKLPQETASNSGRSDIQKLSIFLKWKLITENVKFPSAH